MQFTWAIGGEAGFGITTIGLTFAKICTRLGYYTFDYAEFPSLIRGGFNAMEVVISDTPVYSCKREIDLMICLNQDSYERHKARLTPQSFVLYDPSEVTVGEHQNIELPFRHIQKSHRAFQVMMNTIAVGASFSVMGFEMEPFYQMIEEEFGGRKGAEVVEHNRTLAKEGYEYVKTHYSGLKSVIPQPHAGSHGLLTGDGIPDQVWDDNAKLVLTANDSFALGAAIADCRFYAAYPMSPSSTVLGILAGWSGKHNIVVRHVEDEVGVINEAVGASFTGVRSAVGTSGGGFALMTEGVSYAGIAEIPLVVFIAQRPGPATGLPTWTAQGDLQFAVHGGHGEFPKIVLAPGDAAEMIELTAKAFDLADVYQTPVIVLSDKLISESHLAVDKSWLENFVASYKPNRGKIVTSVPEGEKYLRYKVESSVIPPACPVGRHSDAGSRRDETDDGISPLLIPGLQKTQFWQANSYEHKEDSHTTEDAVEVKQQVDKRARKTQTYLKDDFVMPKVYGSIENSTTVLVGYGSTKGVMLEAQKMIKEKGIDIAVVHFTHMYPLNSAPIRDLLTRQKNYILIENDSEGQLDHLLREQCLITLPNQLLKYDGRPIWPHEVVEKVMEQ